MRKYLEGSDTRFEVEKVSHSAITSVAAAHFDYGKEHACTDIRHAGMLSL